MKREFLLPPSSGNGKGNGHGPQLIAVANTETGRGRKIGPTRMTMQLKDAVLYAAQEHGRDGQGRDGLQGYLWLIAHNYPIAFTQLLAKVLPLQVRYSGEVVHSYRSIDEIKRDLIELGVPVDRIYD
jgi:hypothetical protein